MAITSSRGISLANKCQLLFGLAVLLILTAALSVPWFRMERMIDEKEFDLARQLADAWIAGDFDVSDRGRIPENPDGIGQTDGEEPTPANEEVAQDGAGEGTTSESGQQGGAADPTPFHIEPVPLEEIARETGGDSFASEALTWLQERPESPAYQQVIRTPDRPTTYRYARLLRGESLEAIRGREAADRRSSEDGEPPLWGVLLVERHTTSAMTQTYVNRIYLVLAGLMACGLAFLVFYFITTRLILSPVRVLRETAERASQGELYVRSDISTGDEFEELSDTFNLMLGNLKLSQDQLRKVNKGLDLKINELAESNVSLMEASRLKSEFLANVSHELRTPLNSIIGFAEVIQGLDERTAQPAEEEKRRRYVEHILTSGRSLLELINDLLDLAKIEAGRLEIETEPTNVADVCEGLATLIRPQAEKNGVHLEVSVAPTTPIIETDPGRFEQIIFNFLSNAVKFTPRGGEIRLTAERSWSRESGEMVRIAVADTGPGISHEQQAIIFEKFRQVDAGHTREHQGTGLGLAICTELSKLLGGRINLVSEPGEGATFILILPVKLSPAAPQSLMPATPSA